MATVTFERLIKLHEHYIWWITEDVKKGKYNLHGYMEGLPKTAITNATTSTLQHQIARLLSHRKDAIYYTFQKILRDHCIEYDEFDKYNW